MTTAFAEGQLELVGRIMPASNQTFLCTIGPDQVKAVYKPIMGERPLWDFPDGTLANREYAAWVVSEQLGWDVVPLTLLREGPHGPGMVQLWREPVEGVSPVDIVPGREVPPGYLHVLDAHDQADRPVSLIHEDSGPLRRMAIFDALINNTDRKGGHVLAMADGHRYGVDHGVCFHVDDKLRTVLWGFAGYHLTDEELEAVQRFAKSDVWGVLEDLLALDEVAALRRRCKRVLKLKAFPVPEDGWPSIPWPPF